MHQEDRTAAQLMEAKLLNDYYNQLTAVLDVKNLSAHFVSANILTIDDDEEISCTVTSKEKAKIVLRKIKKSLEINTKDLNSMLDVMINYGNGANATLANEIKSKLSPIHGATEQNKQNPPAQGDDTPDISSQFSGKKEGKVPKENLLYTVGDLTKEVKDALDKFDKNILNEQRDKQTIDNVLLLLMVVNPSEFLAAMYYFSKQEAMVLNSGGNIYYVGKWGQIPAALVRQNEQGTAGPNGAQQVTCSSINLFKNLKVIIALGVCGTMGRLGDVVVSSRIDACNLYKVKDDQLINRSLKCRPGKNIHGFLLHTHEIWSFQCTKPATGDYKALAVFKPMLSGSPLIAYGEYRDKLIANVSQEAGGVEMEGIGVIDGIDIANKRDKIEFIIVKAGCDYADESKNKEWQPVAAMAAADFVYKQLDRKIVHEWILDKPDEPLITL